FPRSISFLDLIKIDKLVYGNWEVLKGKFMEILEWFYLGYLGQECEEAKISRHGEPRDVAVNCRGTAGRERPQVSAKINAEVEDMPDETPRKRSRTKREDVDNGGNYEETNHGKETSTSSSDDFIIIT
nr:bulb-type lectin domain-containing protein [Tanacetum cinerariifolium]